MAKEDEKDTKEKDGDQKKVADSEGEGESKAMGMKELHDMLKEHMPMLKKINDMIEKHMGGESDEKKDEKADPAMDDPDFKPTTEKDAKTGNGKGVTDEDEKKDKEAMDKAMDAAITKKVSEQIESFKKTALKQITRDAVQRDELAGQLSNFVGTFDHSEMSREEVAAYGVKQLGIKCDAGQEFAALSGFLHNRNSGRMMAFSMDAMGGAGGKDDLYEATSKKMYN